MYLLKGNIQCAYGVTPRQTQKEDCHLKHVQYIVFSSCSKVKINKLLKITLFKATEMSLICLFRVNLVCLLVLLPHYFYILYNIIKTDVIHKYHVILHVKNVKKKSQKIKFQLGQSTKTQSKTKAKLKLKMTKIVAL